MLAGGKYIPPDLLGDSESSLTDVDGPHITRRQLDVLQLIVRGASNREIASELELSEYTVRIHVAALLKLFAARNRTHLVAIAREKKIVFD
jgi:DNA-binding NarL/FixJ family response regulator